MSKQSQDQDEQQAPSGEAQGGADAGTAQRQAEDDNKTGGSSSRRSRRRGKGGRSSSAASSASSNSDAAASHEATASGGVSTSASSDTNPKDDTTGSDAASASTAVSDASKDSQTMSSSGKSTQNTQNTKGASASAAKSSSAASASNSKTSDKTTASAAGKADKSAGPSGKGSGGSGSGGGTGQAAPSGKGSKTGALALVLVILLAIVVGVLGWMGWQRLQSQQQALSQVPDQPATQSRVDELAGQVQSMQGERESMVSSLREEFDAYRSDVNANLDQVLQQLSQQQNTDEREWLHAEAAYLLRLANQRLQLERDVEGAAALLRTADQRLKEANNPALMPVRREISSELAALRSVPQVDRTGLFLTFNALQEQIAGRPLAQDVEEVTGDASIQEAPSGGWQEQLSTVGQELKDLVTVRKHDEALEALISPEQESYLRQSVRLVLEQVQLALLKEEQELYDASIDKALKLITGYYDTDDSGVQGVVSQLEELKGQQIRPELPDISGSQQAMQAFIQNRFESRGAASSAGSDAGNTGDGSSQQDADSQGGGA